MFALCTVLALVLGPCFLIVGVWEYLAPSTRTTMPATPRSLVKSVLREAYRAIRTGYTTKALVRRENGDPCFVTDPHAVAWSLAGAMQLGESRIASKHGAGPAWGAYSDACELIQREIPAAFNRNLLRWGDQASAEQALKILEQAGREC